VYVDTRAHDGVLEIVVDRPDRRNALDGEGWRGIIEGIERLDQHADARVGVIRSTGPIFSAGADVRWLRSAPESELALVCDGLDAIRRCPKPIVCRVQGPTFGGGVGLAAAGDVSVAGARATFTFSEVRLGIVPALISRVVIERIGVARFRSWALLGQAIEAPDALAGGLVDHVATDEGLDAAVDDVVDALRRGEPAALAAIKRIGPAGPSRDDAARLLRELRDRPAFDEGIAALREGRPPAWAQ
jgi:methylglutaconyl-CoA hydratase